MDTHTMPHADVEPGVTIGPWVVRQRWDRGSFGVVFRVERAGHPEAGSFALKLALQAEDARFTREVALLQSLQNPSVPRFEDRGWWDSPRGGQYPYLVMEWVEGKPLYEWARSTRRTSRQVIHVLEQLSSALACAHAAGAVHRDVKGDNVLVTSEGRAVLLDWGCGIHLGAVELTDGPLGPGTAAYRSPESLRWSWAHRLSGERYEPKGTDDVYALGVTAYRLCTGTYPPPVEEASGPPRRLFPPRELATISAGLDELLLACLHEEPLRRPPAASLFIALRHAACAVEAAALILPTPAAADTEKASRPGPPRRSPLLVGGLAVAVSWALVALVLLGTQALRARDWGALLMMRGKPSAETPDAGIGEEALASAETGHAILSPFMAYGRAMPNEPLPGQRTPPCRRGEKEINGGCWLGPIEGERAPCGDTLYDYQGKCYAAVGPVLRSPTSEEPR